MPKLDDLIEFSGEDNVYEVEKIVGVHRQPVKTKATYTNVTLTALYILWIPLTK